MLCDKCQGMLDLDVFPDAETSYDHHKSYTALCISASSGCELCQAIKDEQSRRLKLEDDFDAKLPAEDTQIKVFAFDRKGNVQGICRIRIGQHALMRSRPVDQHKLNMLWVFFGLCVQDNDPMSSHIRGRILSPTSSSPPTFTTIKSWLHRCLTTHPTCHPNSDPTPSILPTRVIDVSLPTPILVTTSSQPGEWVTLSHCWGTSKPLVTTADTISTFSTTGIELSSLPATYQDAVTITRELGYRYLWIDSLCILQDSREDWLHESSAMREVYRNAVFNISADASSSPDTGIFAAADSQRELTEPVIRVPCWSSKDGVRGEVGFCRDVFTSQLKSPLQERAWVLQESIFSPRRIRYLSAGVEWGCDCTRYCCEDDPAMERIIGHIKDKHSIFQMLAVSADDMGEEGEARIQEVLRWWYGQLGDYLGRQVTFISDRLPAIAGVAKEVAERTGYRYLAGLWEEDLLAGLLWAAPGVGTKEGIGPSWSWAGVDCRRFVRSRTMNGLSACGWVEEPRAKVLGVEVKYVHGDDVYGEVEWGRLTLKGPCRSVQWPDKPVPFLETVTDRRDILERHRFMDIHRERFAEPEQITLALDRRFEKGEKVEHLLPRGAIYLQITRFGNYDLKRRADVRGIRALVLVPVEGSDGEWRRIGIAQIPEDGGMADGWEERSVMIV